MRKTALIAAAALLLMTACSFGVPAPPPMTPTFTPAPIQPTADPTQAPPPTGEPLPEDGAARTEQLFVFKNSLVQALTHRDWEFLRGLMEDGVNVMGMPDGLFSADRAIAGLQEQLPVPPISEMHELDLGYFEYEDGSWQGQTFEELMGFHVNVCCGSGVFVAAAVLVDGWGAQGDQQALLIIQDRGTEGWVWWGYAPLAVGSQ